MEQFFAEYGIGSETFRIIILPLLIFIARILDVSINTIRIIFVMSGRKFVSTILGFFESLIWLLAIGQIFQHIDNVYSYIAYPAGFAMGILVGMLIEERLALGKVVVRIISSEDLSGLLSVLQKQNVRYTMVSAESDSGEEKLLFTVLMRDNLPLFIEEIQRHAPKAFYTIESVKSASEAGILAEQPSRRGIGAWLTSVRRK
ncbi:hypothetical protein C900_04630 [Fulvivirga imtechensis AK7]|uniref:UPF0316 protein C900_04630 n=1 Tax=Fulvivirga imtechensis AK7 TaxID=1237149 RepID=L8JNP9_9BACT|nr:DUF5698 domain-containing protein [Fulvivirga imtechensis]ELR69783.1 hypothetical protein C900_04630 [Fulvivirga imtechensis AK7]